MCIFLRNMKLLLCSLYLHSINW
uniref:Uncharacterized protein n=1 Tax=Anguilla anguilla TaxID=7936 RepID=A0A0E9UF89_ANGAN